MLVRFAVCSALILGVACATAATTALSPSPPRQLTLAVGEAVEAAAGGPRITFLRVVDESRCPTGVSCVWDGDATVEVRAAADTVLLHTSDAREQSATAGGLRLRVVGLEPRPSADGPPAPGDYRLTLSTEPAQ